MAKLKKWQKNVLAAVFIIVAGFILFNLAFMLAALVINLTMSIMGQPQNVAPPFVGRVAYSIIILLISWLILKSKLNDLIKAAFLTMPLMVILIMLGISLYQQPIWLLGLIGSAGVGIVLLYLYKKKLVWYYYFSTFYVAVLVLCIMIFQIEI
jgi:hypothetical protein